MYTVLICDDQPDIVNALKIYLTPEGYRLLKAYTGQEAVELARREVESRGLYMEKLSDTVPHLVVRVGHPLARLNRPIRAEDLYGQSFVIYPELD